MDKETDSRETDKQRRDMDKETVERQTNKEETWTKRQTVRNTGKDIQTNKAQDIKVY